MAHVRYVCKECTKLIFDCCDATSAPVFVLCEECKSKEGNSMQDLESYMEDRRCSLELRPVEETPKKLASQALLWDDKLKCYVTTFIKFSDREELDKRLAEEENAHFSFVQWPLVANGKEVWEEVE